MTKYLFIVGGVISGLGKGITAASISRLLTSHGLRVTNIKIDAYVNIDAGTMNPVEHGEVFVTDDGVETDQDIGNYERFLDRDLSDYNYATTGQIFKSVIERERNLGYSGKCVEVVPDIPEEIIRRIEMASKKDEADITIVEIGGTIGEYQNILFIEAARMMKYRYRKDVLVLMVSYVPIPANLGEMKTKPTQYASRTLNESGIQADFIIARGEKPLDEPRRRKIATLCNMESREDIISCPDVGNIYDVPMILKKQNLDQLILEKLGIHTQKDDISAWNELLEKIRKARSSVKIAIVGKYFTTGGFILADVYVSVIEAIKHGCYAMGVRPEMEWIDSQVFEDEPEKLNMLDDFDGLVVPGGFGTRAVDGIISAVKYARENKTPYLGLCYGMQLAAVEYARNVCGITNANSLEIDKDTDEPVINLMSDQVKKLLGKKYGGTMRLGAYPCELKPGTIAGEIYKRNMISERHRHRYEFNNKYKEIMEEKGLVFSGWNPDLGLVEIIELKKQDHPFFMGVQFHPEFKSRPLSPHPVFVNYIKACKEKKMKW